MKDNENMIILTDSKGNETELEFLDIIEYGGHSYAVMAQEGVDEVVIMEQVINPDGETATYNDVLNDDVINNVFEIFLNENK